MSPPIFNPRSAFWNFAYTGEVESGHFDQFGFDGSLEKTSLLNSRAAVAPIMRSFSSVDGDSVSHVYFNKDTIPVDTHSARAQGRGNKVTLIPFKGVVKNPK